jgi:hypothetical protein
MDNNVTPQSLEGFHRLGRTFDRKAVSIAVRTNKCIVEINRNNHTNLALE